MSTMSFLRRQESRSRQHLDPCLRRGDNVPVISVAACTGIEMTGIQNTKEKRHAPENILCLYHGQQEERHALHRHDQ